MHQCINAYLKRTGFVSKYSLEQIIDNISVFTVLHFLQMIDFYIWFLLGV